MRDNIVHVVDNLFLTISNLSSVTWVSKVAAKVISGCKFVTQSNFERSDRNQAYRDS